MNSKEKKQEYEEDKISKQYYDYSFRATFSNPHLVCELLQFCRLSDTVSFAATCKEYHSVTTEVFLKSFLRHVSLSRREGTKSRNNNNNNNYDTGYKRIVNAASADVAAASHYDHDPDSDYDGHKLRIVNDTIRGVFRLCPLVDSLDLSFTGFSDENLEGFEMEYSLKQEGSRMVRRRFRRLHALNLSGNPNMIDINSLVALLGLREAAPSVPLVLDATALSIEDLEREKEEVENSSEGSHEDDEINDDSDEGGDDSGDQNEEEEEEDEEEEEQIVDRRSRRARRRKRREAKRKLPRRCRLERLNLNGCNWIDIDEFVSDHPEIALDEERCNTCGRRSYKHDCCEFCLTFHCKSCCSTSCHICDKVGCFRTGSISSSISSSSSSSINICDTSGCIDSSNNTASCAYNNRNDNDNTITTSSIHLDARSSTAGHSCTTSSNHNNNSSSSSSSSADSIGSASIMRCSNQQDKCMVVCALCEQVALCRGCLGTVYVERHESMGRREELLVQCDWCHKFVCNVDAVREEAAASSVASCVSFCDFCDATACRVCLLSHKENGTSTGMAAASTDSIPASTPTPNMKMHHLHSNKKGFPCSCQDN